MAGQQYGQCRKKSFSHGVSSGSSSVGGIVPFGEREKAFPIVAGDSAGQPGRPLLYPKEDRSKHHGSSILLKPANRFVTSGRRAFPFEQMG